MSKSQKLQKQATKLRADERKHNAMAKQADSASDEAAERFHAESAKVKAEEVEKRAKKAKEIEKSGKDPGLFF